MIFLALANCVWAQDTTMKKSSEYFFSLTSASTWSCAFKYKKQIKDKVFMKAGLVDIYAQKISSYPQNQVIAPNRTLHATTHITNISAGVQIGLEFRKILNEKFTFFHGPSPSITYRVLITENENPALPLKDRKKIEKPGINWSAPYTLGLLYNFNEHFLAYAEINPGLYVEIDKSETLKTISSLLKFSNNTGFFSIGYRM